MKKKAPHRGAFFCRALGRAPTYWSGYSRRVDHRSRGRAVSVFRQDLGRRFHAGTAARGHAELFLQSPQVRRAGSSSLADLLVRDRVTDADVHENQPVSVCRVIQSQMRMIVNSIKYNPRRGYVGARLAGENVAVARKAGSHRGGLLQRRAPTH